MAKVTRLFDRPKSVFSRLTIESGASNHWLWPVNGLTSNTPWGYSKYTKKGSVTHPFADHLFIIKANGVLLEEGHPARLFTEEKLQ